MNWDDEQSITEAALERAPMGGEHIEPFRAGVIWAREQMLSDGPVERLAARNYNLRLGADDDGWPRTWSDLELEAWKHPEGFFGPDAAGAYTTKANIYRSEAREQLRTALKEYEVKEK